MTGVEIDFVVTDCQKALKLYEKIFDLVPIEVTGLSKGENEVIFSIYGVRFHMLDENREFQLVAPDPAHPNTIWFNIMVPDIYDTYRKAMEAGCMEVQPVIELTDFGVSNAMFTDQFGYLWMLHQVHREVSFEERMKLWEEEKNKIQ